MARQPDKHAVTATRLKAAVANARAGAWADAHDLAQALEGEPVADWLHAVLHKIEGDHGNARYWYSRCGKCFDDFSDPDAELAAIADHLARRHEAARP